MGRYRLARPAALVAGVAAAVVLGIAVQYLPVSSCLRHPHPVTAPQHRREVAEHQQLFSRFAAQAPEGDHVLAMVLEVDPAEALRRTVQLVEGRFIAINPVEVGQVVAQLAVRFVLEQVPVQSAPAVPLPPLAELAAHEEQFPARLGVEIAKQQPEAGEFLPVVAGHLSQQGSLAVDDLVMGERQDEVFAEGVNEAEGQFFLVITAEERVLPEVGEGVVHPAQVPLVAEAEAALPGGARDLRPGGGLLGHRAGVREEAVDGFVEPLQEGDRLQVFASPVAVGHPFARPARVVEIEHRGDRVNPQPVEMVAVEPEEGAADQEIGHLVAPVVEDVGSPVPVFALARVGVFVEGGAVEPGQAVVVGREVGRRPVEDDSDPVAVQVVDEPGEVLRLAVPAGGGEVAGGLVAPGFIEGVLGDRQQFDVGEAEGTQVLDQARGQFPVVQEPAVGPPVPGAEVQFVNRDRRSGLVALEAIGHPLPVRPLEAPGVVDDRGGARTQFHAGTCKRRLRRPPPSSPARSRWYRPVPAGGASRPSR
ncbi:MAG: hypothetical protein BWY73_00731 [candidate division TA06 bacterium ADurb.Bin417]|uniref:Uncharacterized protein n=1 Tax=candidate division TA06 bacterium ADurb.Bin417 TaxID=1852828 RepID=A0A1V5MH64_UNCT6|nr:MAG: hypothetical protein BWY73_00731 [candidate division TA06 bacterium ADurb.Bin417]